SQGLTNADIAGRLGLSVNTVRVHIHGILQRLQLDNRMQVVLRAARKQTYGADDNSRYDA
ncbi:MAG TPA: LuxR C-terminal-related transcriptional regulator, partial [Kiloniellaceae bacterium]|nr:LuxR C-terminal-related transcriptional regulator [Kiloniellaceae bacterium]